MFGWYEISKAANHHLKIRYSVGNCSDCDGEILYNRENGNFYLIELARGTTKLTTRYYVEGIRQVLAQGDITWQKTSFWFSTMYPLPNASRDWHVVESARFGRRVGRCY